MQMASGEYKIEDSAKFISPPPVVGGYDITGRDGLTHSINFTFYKKPNMFHRTMTRLILGWTWFNKK